MLNSANPFSMIKPIGLEASMVTSSSVTDGDPSAWSAATAYVPGQVVSVPGTQQCYECLVANSNAPAELNTRGANPKWKQALTYAVAWSAAATYVKGARVRLDSTHRVYEAQRAHKSTLGTSGAVTISIAAPGVVTWNGHGLAADMEVVFSSTGSLPGGIAAGVTYYVLSPAANTFSLAAAPGGPAITTTGAQSGTHTATATSTSPEVAGDGDIPTWLDIAPTNAHAMFDDKWGTQTIAANSLTVSLTPGCVVDSMVGLNLLGNQVTITCTVGGAVIYTKVIPLQTDIGVYDWATYFLAPIVAQDDVVATDLLPYYTQTITFTIEGPAAVGIGNIVLGNQVKLGVLEASPKAGIIDFGTKERDKYGNISFVEGEYSKRFGGRLVTESNFVDQLAAILAQVRSKPVVWIGAGGMYSSLIVWGTFKDFEVDIAYPTISYCTITIEGLV